MPAAPEPIVELSRICKTYAGVRPPEKRRGGLGGLFRRKGAVPPVAVPSATVPSAAGAAPLPESGPEAGVTVLSGVSLCVRRGEFVAVQGTSGSGKSTLLHLIGLLDTPTSGVYRLLGRDVSALDDAERSRLRNAVLGFVFQSFYLVPYATALENVMLPGMYADVGQAELRARALELLARVGLAERAHFRPAGLSGGQQQRVAMARALVNRPSLILADEPTGQLDSATSAEIMRLFAQINADGATVILVTHDAAVARAAGRVIRIADGRVSADSGAADSAAEARD